MTRNVSIMGARKAIYKQNPVHVAITIALKLENLLLKKVLRIYFAGFGYNIRAGPITTVLVREVVQKI
jgi:hypothetical protein